MMKGMRLVRWPIAFALLVACTACGLGDGTGVLTGSLYLRGCTRNADYGAMGAPAAYDMRPVYFVADPVNALASLQPLHPVNKLALRVQPRGNRQEEADLLFVNVGDDAQVAAMKGQALPIGATSDVRASLTLRETCPNAEVEPELDGTMTWTSFGSADATNGIQFGDRLAATFDFEILDRRQIAIGGIGPVPTTPAAGGHVSGSFDFIVRQGKAAQAY
jgi:hypothetical protein